MEAADKMNVRQEPLSFNRVNDGITLYHRPKDAQCVIGGQKMSIINSLFKYGFNREFTSSNGGNMYGAGVYTVYNLRSSNEKARGYGKAIIKVKLLGGYKDFLIFSKQLAQETYGNRWEIQNQVYDIFGKDKANKILHTIHLIMHDDRASFKDMARSSDAAYKVVLQLGEAGMNNSKCRGLVYNGGHDGACCFIRDFSSVIPVAVSYDNGQTWHNELTQELLDRMSNEVDTHFQYGSNSKFSDVADKSVNGYTMVWDKSGKVNYIPANSNDVISDVWFDNGENWQKSSNGESFVNVKYGDYYLSIFNENGKYMVYDEDGCPLDCTVDELPNII